MASPIQWRLPSLTAPMMMRSMLRWRAWSRIVFLIDWNRARKRLRPLVGKNGAITVLAEAARLNVGHRAWLQLGGERLIFGAMQAAGESAFRIGDRLDEIIGAVDARAFLLAVMRLACDALRAGKPAALVADETRMLLAQHVRHRTSEFDLLTEHASYCHALAQALAMGWPTRWRVRTRLRKSSPTGQKSGAQGRPPGDASAEKAERQPRWRHLRDLRSSPMTWLMP